MEHWWWLIADEQLVAGDRYIESFRKLANSANTKTMVLPADILGAVKGLVGRKES